MTKFLRFVERLLFVTGIVALGWYATVQMYASREQAALSRELAAQLVGRDAGRDFRLATPGDAEASPYTTGMRKASVGAAVAKIEVPRIRLSTIAREGLDARTLRVAAGHVPGTALPGEIGNSAFAAHRDTFFRPLKNVREGDDVVVTTPTGAHRYVVTGIDIVQPEDVEVLAATSEPTLTLVTCYPFNYIGSAPQRFIVRARLSNP